MIILILPQIAHININQIMIECTYIPVLQDCVSVEGQALPLQELCLMIIGFLVCVEVPHPLQLLQALHVYLQLIGQH